MTQSLNESCLFKTMEEGSLIMPYLNKPENEHDMNDKPSLEEAYPASESTLAPNARSHGSSEPCHTDDTHANIALTSVKKRKRNAVQDTIQNNKK